MQQTTPDYEDQSALKWKNHSNVTPAIIKKDLIEAGIKVENYAKTSTEFKDYRIILGKGAFGKVTEGRMITGGAEVPVAIKRLRPNKLKHSLNQLRMEILVMADVHDKNPNSRMIKLLGVDFEDTTQGQASICMLLELCDNGNMHDLVALLGGLDSIVARTYFIQLVEGVKALHDSGYIHRDLKPENLLLDRNFNLKIADFGISHPIAKGLGKTYRQWPGTPLFKSPEVKQRKEYDETYDIWSCGVILFIFICGAPPFDDNGYYWDLLENQKHYLFWCFHQHYHFLDDGAQDLINKMLMYKYRQRISIPGIQGHDWYKAKILPNDCVNRFALKNRVRSLMDRALPSRSSRKSSKLEQEKEKELEDISGKNGSRNRPMKEIIEQYFVNIPTDILEQTIEEDFSKYEPMPFTGRLAGDPETMATGKGPLHFNYVMSKLEPHRALKALVAFFRQMNKINPKCTFTPYLPEMRVESELNITLEDGNVVVLELEAQVFKTNESAAEQKEAEAHGTAKPQSLVVFDRLRGEAEKFSKFFVVALSILGNAGS
mmetsp:Transcript_14236/g.28717  ORF Transcript_14236/g.28717 Transcript_14236/m.28717 type:complete len:545 (+) Transcript_14236:75-1709(+)